MKTRTGFVSNSSSSSFVVAVKKNEVCPTCHRSDDSFLNRFKRDDDDYYGDSKIVAEEVEEIVETLKKDYGDDFESVCGEMGLFRGILETYVDNGYNVAYIRISYHDESMANEFEALRDSKRLVVLKDMN